MKINARTLGSYLSGTYDGNALLIYGPHETLNETLARAIIYRVCEKTGTSFATLSTCDTQTLTSCLAPQPSLLGDNDGIKIPLILEAKDSITQIVLEAIPLAQKAKVPIILSSSGLNTRSKLVKALNDDEGVHAAGMYESTSEMRAQLLRVFAIYHGFEISPKILAFIAERTNEDSNLEDLAQKVGLLVNDQTEVLPSQITALIGSLSVEVDSLTWAFFEKSADRFNKLNSFLKSGESPITFIRHTLRLLKQMLEARVQYESGTSITNAVGQLRPVPLFTVRARFEAFCRNHTTPQITQMIRAFNELEVQAKLNPELFETSACEVFSRAA